MVAEGERLREGWEVCRAGILEVSFSRCPGVWAFRGRGGRVRLLARLKLEERKDSGKWCRPTAVVLVVAQWIKNPNPWLHSVD